MYLENTKLNIGRKDETVIKNISLNKLENRALEILKDRSVLYKTPNKTKLMPFVTPKTVTQPESKLFSLYYKTNNNK